MTRPLALMPNIVILSNESAQSLSSPYDFSGGEQISPPMETPSLLCQFKWMEIAVGKGVSAVFMNCGSSEKMTVWRIQFRCSEMAAVTIVSELSIIDDGLPWLSLLTGRLGMGVNFVRFPPALDRMDDPNATGT
ncbi:hypothetical protein BLNAU_22614 [Blattamonas nauphoetae]|uniref:Uncharacterized protein n=1 Tax=Blattamonas nauphoetae TaxID=2049346 RepID=A0ABQ9WT12_9EUKA|nr:hypothetical protein BLNAU_22614 [Blattamonas nauphoetae]